MVIVSGMVAWQGRARGKEGGVRTRGNRNEDGQGWIDTDCCELISGNE